MSTPAPLGGDALRDEIRRRAYLTGVLVGAPAVAANWLVRRAHDLFVGGAYPFLAVFLVVLFWGLWSRRFTIATAERVVAVVLTVFFLGHIGVAVHGAPDLATATVELTESGFLNVVLLFMFAYLAFRTRTALTFSVGIYTAFLVIVGSRVVPEVVATGSPADAIGYLRGSVALGVSIALLYALAHVKEQLAETRSTATMLDALAYTDPLTGVANRRRLHQALEHELSLVGRSTDDLAVLLLDLDGFKRVNDEHGHDVGDAVLQAVAQALQGQLRAGDLLGRWGGEEFLVLAPGTDIAQGRELAERCRAVLAEQHFDPVGTVTASFGVAARRPGDTAASLLKRADDATYGAKNAGRNRVITTQAPSST